MRNMTVALLMVGLLLGSSAPALAQATTGSIAGIVVDAQKQPVAGANVIAIHEPSGTSYETTTRADGRFSIPNMRVGGPYTVTVAYTGGGAAFEPQTRPDVVVNLGGATDLTFEVKGITVTETVTVTAQTDPVFSSARTGAADTVTREVLAALPTINQRLQDITRLTPQAGGGGSFAGSDNRLNNVTVDGSAFNNSFGLGGAPGERTNVAPISLDAVEEVQVNIAPYDVRQGNFVGAGVNTVTRSGTNAFRGSLFHRFRDNDLVGTQAKDQTFNPGLFNFRNTGGWVSGPVLRNRLFFFGSVDGEKRTAPGTTFRANRGGETVAGNVTRVQAADLERLSAFLKSSFNYDPGAYEGYEFNTPGFRPLIRLDHNVSNAHKLSFRYIHLDSETDQLVSDSSSLGFGNRRTRTDALNFANSNYTILEDIRSGVGELNSTFGNSIANTFIIGYSTHDESRGAVEANFPFVDILNAAGGTTYTSFGPEPFTPNNELRYQPFQVRNNLTRFAGRHSLTVGGSFERYQSENVFFPGQQSVYVYNSVDDFITDAAGYLANPNRTTSPVSLRRFQVRWMNIPGLDKPVQPLEVNTYAVYAQDEWRPRNDLTVTAGVRADIPAFGKTAYANPNADSLTFRDEAGNGVRYSSGQLPDTRAQWSPRIGFNWDVNGQQRTQIRGGTGVFTGPPLFVWISNQIGNTGVLTGFEQLDNTTSRPFNPDPNRYKPASVTGAPAASYELALTDQDFKFPQVWRSNVGIDQRLPFGLTGTAEFIYGRDVNGIYYINANLAPPIGNLAGADNRPRWAASPANRIHAHVSNATVMKNQNVGRNWNMAASLRRTFRDASFRTAYSYGESKNTIDPGSIAFGSWNNNQHAGDPNNPGLGFSQFSPGHRFYLFGSYRRNYLGFGATTLTAFWESRTIGNVSLVFGGDLNGDGGTSNDLIYIHRNASEMNFQTFTAGSRTFTAEEQAAAWDRLIESSNYLRSRRGQYMERNALFLPMVHRLDLSVAQDLFTDFRNSRHALQLRLDILNFTNMLNNNWGVGQRVVNTQPFTNPGVDAQGRATYRLRVINNELMSRLFEQTVGISDVYQLQISLRYSFR